MDKRHLAFWLLVAVIWFAWMQYMERQFGGKPRVRKPAEAKVDFEVAQTPESKGKEATETEKPATRIEPKPAAAEVPLREDLVLGVDQPDTDAEYAIFARLTNRGAAVNYLQLNRYKNEHLNGPLVLLREETPGVHSFLLTLRNDSELAERNWEVVKSTPEEVVFRTTALDGQLQLEKRFRLRKDSSTIDLDVQFTNLTDEPITGEVAYELTGGNGLPIEGVWYTSYFRRMVAVMKPANGARPYYEEQASEYLAKLAPKGNAMPKYSVTPLQYAGIVSQYFASLVVQKPDPLDKRLIGSAEPVMLSLATTEPHLSNIGVKTVSTPFVLRPREQVMHEYLLYNGPKEPISLRQVDTQADINPDEEAARPARTYHLDLVIYYPDWLFLPIGSIARGMVWIVDHLYSLFGDYGIAIILLTVIVRLCLFPLSLKQTQSMAKMQALAPQMEEIKEKYKGDREKLNRAIMDLYASNKVNPFGGCLIIFLQLPIFVGLWQSLYNAFSLRQSSFFYNLTWINDLSAPDQLFRLGFWTPGFIGPFFNLLPILAVVQMIVQMHIMSPPSTTPEQAAQQKMMKFMMAFMGLMFYKVPAGLCVYIITSGLWSMAERKLLPKATPPAAGPPAAQKAITATQTQPSWITPLKRKKTR